MQPDLSGCDGVILLSTALDVRIFLSGAPGNDLAYATGLPTYAATAYYHNQLPEKPANLEAFLAEAREFAATEYLTALFRGDALSEADTAAVAAKLHRFTGLSEPYLRRSHLRVSADHFLKELLRERGEVLGVHDTRFRGKDPDEAGEYVAWDPFLFGIAGPFVTANAEVALSVDPATGDRVGLSDPGMGRVREVLAAGKRSATHEVDTRVGTAMISQ